MSGESNEIENEKGLSPKDLEQVQGGAVNAFLKLGEIKGESTEPTHKGELE
jgi:hypothetical protein